MSPDANACRCTANSREGTGARIGVTCVITKVDKVDPATRNRTKDVSASEKVSDLRKRVEREVGVSANQVRLHTSESCISKLIISWSFSKYGV